jgi:hypothetical protein
MSTYFAQVVAIKQAMLDVLTSNMGASGMLYGIKSIGGTFYSETGVWPFIGLDIVQIQKPEFVSIHKLRHCIEFCANVSVRSNTLLIDARTALNPFLDDGQGNGLLQIIREQYYQLLDGLIEKVDQGQIIFISNVSENASSPPTAFFSEAAVFFNVYFTVNI